MTRADLEEWLDEVGAKPAEEIKLVAAPNSEVFVLSVYRANDGVVTLDIGDE